MTLGPAPTLWGHLPTHRHPEAATPTYYELLGVSSVASHEDVRDAYREQALRLHPDRQRDASPDQARDAAHQMRQVNDAWRILGDPTLRAAYDADLARAEREQREPMLPSVDGADVDFVVDADDEAWSPTPRRSGLRQFLPIVLLLIGLVFVLVVTAYAR